MMEVVFKNYGAFILRKTESIGLSLIQVTKGANIFDIIEALQNEPSVEFAEPNYILRASFNPNDPHFSSGKQWGLNNVGQIPPGGTTDADIDAPEAWDITQGSSNIKIAILDSGIPLINGSLSHEDLNNVNRIELGPDFVYGTFGLTDSDPTIKDLAGHGTHVTGIVGAETNNSLGIAGIAPNCKILSIQVGDANIATTTEVMANGIIAAVNLGANIINISYGSYFPTTAVEVAIYNVTLPANVIIVSSTGNENGEVLYPARYSSLGSIPSYPDGYPNVIAVGATNQFDERSSYSNFGFALNVVAPGGYGGTFDEDDIFSTLPNYPVPNMPLNYGYAAGTSMSAPVVAGIAALILSVNPSLTPGQVRDIIQQTADDKGTAGRDDYYGWGRVNAFQAVLSSLALINKSVNYDATSHNNNHIIERGYFGKLHKVFFSGGEIFYRRSSNNGTSWEITKRISTGNGSNNHPSIVAGVGNTDVLRLVWQRNLDDTHYEIWYSYSNNSGTDWSIPAIVPGCTNVAIQYYQSNPGAGPGPTPVVASFWRGGAEGTPCFLLVYADQNGLRYRFANDNNLSWTIPSNDIVPGSNFSSIVWYPCLTSYNSQGFNVNLIYDDRFTHVYSQIYNEDGTWTNRVIADGVGTYNRMSSVALDYTNNTLGVWSGWNGSNYVIRFRQGFANGTWSSWSKEWSVSGVNSFCPVATYYNKGGAYPYGIDILWFTSSNQIRQKKYYGLGDNWIPADPNTQLLYSNGLFPNITHERQNTTIPKQIHTDQTIQPYSLMDNSLNLPKENLMVGGANYRAAEITDSLTNSNFRIELKEPVITLTTGEKIVLPFKEYNYHATLALSTENVFTYLQTKLYGIPNTAQSITFKINIVAS